VRYYWHRDTHNYTRFAYTISHSHFAQNSSFHMQTVYAFLTKSRCAKSFAPARSQPVTRQGHNHNSPRKYIIGTLRPSTPDSVSVTVGFPPGTLQSSCLPPPLECTPTPGKPPGIPQPSCLPPPLECTKSQAA
jgi:hypothetical protein